MAWVATAIAGGALLGAYSSNKAANSAENAAANTAATQRYMYDQTRADQKPWRKAGKKALNKLQKRGPNTGIGTFQFDLQSDPGYQFAIDEAMRGTGRQFAAQGMGNSGNVLAALNDRAAGMASQYTNDAWNRQFNEYQDPLNRYQALAGLGQTSTANVGQAGANAANGIGGANAMNANAAYNQWGGYNNAGQQAISNYLTYDYLNSGGSPGGAYGGYTGAYGGGR